MGTSEKQENWRDSWCTLRWWGRQREGGWGFQGASSGEVVCEQRLGRGAQEIQGAGPPAGQRKVSESRAGSICAVFQMLR